MLFEALSPCGPTPICIRTFGVGPTVLVTPGIMVRAVTVSEAPLVTEKFETEFNRQPSPTSATESEPACASVKPAVVSPSASQYDHGPSAELKRKANLELPTPGFGSWAWNSSFAPPPVSVLNVAAIQVHVEGSVPAAP